MAGLKKSGCKLCEQDPLYNCRLSKLLVALRYRTTVFGFRLEKSVAKWLSFLLSSQNKRLVGGGRGGGGAGSKTVD